MRRTQKYTDKFTNEMTGRIAIVLAESQKGLTIPEIQSLDMVLTGITSQKMARMLSHLIEVGLVGKAKGRDGRMHYKCLGVIEAEGGDPEYYRYGANMTDDVAEFKRKYKDGHPSWLITLEEFKEQENVD